MLNSTVVWDDTPQVAKTQEGTDIGLFNTINLLQPWFKTMLILLLLSTVSMWYFGVQMSCGMASNVTLWFEGSKSRQRGVENENMSVILGWSWGSPIRSSEWSQASSSRAWITPRPWHPNRPPGSAHSQPAPGKHSEERAALRNQQPLVGPQRAAWLS